MGKRKVIYLEGKYHLLKQRNDGTGRWNRYGEQKSLKSIVDLIDLDKFEMDISEIKTDVEEYRKKKSLAKVI